MWPLSVVVFVALTISPVGSKDLFPPTLLRFRVVAIKSGGLETYSLFTSLFVITSFKWDPELEEQTEA